MPDASLLYIAGRSSGAWKLVALSAVSAALSAFFGVVFYERYFRYRGCVDALKNSSCVDMSGGNLTGGGVVWSMFAAFSAMLALTLLWHVVCRHRRINAVADVGRGGEQ